MSDFFCGVPFSGIEKHVPSLGVVATREDEAIGLAVGAWFVGKTPMVYMQNSGLGNCVDIITSLLKPYGIEIDLLIGNRTTPEHHALMGQVAPTLMKLLQYEKIIYC